MGEKKKILGSILGTPSPPPFLLLLLLDPSLPSSSNRHLPLPLFVPVAVEGGGGKACNAHDFSALCFLPPFPSFSSSAQTIYSKTVAPKARGREEGTAAFFSLLSMVSIGGNGFGGKGGGGGGGRSLWHSLVFLGGGGRGELSLEEINREGAYHTAAASLLASCYMVEAGWRLSSGGGWW